MTVSRTLAAHIVDLSWDDLPAEQIAQAKRFLLDYLGIALRGSRSETGEILRAFATEQGGIAQSTVIGQSSRVPAVNAAFANAVSEHSIELDDVDELALFHYGPPIISTALAVAQWRGASGSDLLVAIVGACEMMNRLSRATNNELRNRGFHTTPTCGVFAAAAAAGKLMRLTTDQLTNAFGIAGAQASGLMEMYGPSMQKRLNPGPAARNGVTAAILASKGFTGADTILEGERGFGAGFAGKFDAEIALRDLGTDIPVIIEHKPYSAARPIHNAIDCVFEIQAEAQRGADEIKRIVIRRHSDWAHYHLNTSPRSFHEAQVSLPFGVAVAFVLGSALPEQFSAENLQRADLKRIMELIEIEVDDSLARGVTCAMTVIYNGGQTVSSTVDYPKGSPQNPMTQAEIAAKFKRLASGIISVEAIDELQSLVATVEDLTQLDRIFDLVEVQP